MSKMHNILEDVNMDKLNNIDLDTELAKAKEDSSFKAIIKNLNISDDILKKYTSILEDCVCEYKRWY